VSLRGRLVISIIGVFIASLTLGSLLLYWHAVRDVQSELSEALAVGKKMVLNIVDDFDGATTPRRQLEALINDFDGDRYLHVSLLDHSGAVLAAARPLASRESAPDWFYGLLATEPQTARVTLPPPFNQVGVIAIETDQHNRIGEIWSDMVIDLCIIAVLCGLVLGLVYCTLDRALRPLQDMAAAFARVGAHDYAPRLAERGAPEMAALFRGFNHMVVRLAEMEIQNRRLAEQLAAVQDEERADLARDLHDEIGPLLFAMGIDLAAIQQIDAGGLQPKLKSRLDAIRDAVAQVQKHVKEILGRLRPPILVDLGLAPAVDNLVAFWQKRYPHVTFDMDLPDERLDARVDAPVYRIIQESVSNALRHGQPSRVAISVKCQSDDAIEVEITDDGGGMHPPARAGGFGLIGMQDRVSSLGGTLAVGNRPAGRGVTVSARLPASHVPGVPSGAMPQTTVIA
jgi:two-component system, NarL family, sensor histidine kinase UhpB